MNSKPENLWILTYACSYHVENKNYKGIQKGLMENAIPNLNES